MRGTPLISSLEQLERRHAFAVERPPVARRALPPLQPPPRPLPPPSLRMEVVTDALTAHERELAALRAEIRGLREEVASRTHASFADAGVQAPTSPVLSSPAGPSSLPSPPQDPEEEDDLENEVESPPSLSSYCIERAMEPFGPTCDGMLAMLQMVVLTLLQYIMAHGFFDSVWLLDTLDNFPNYADPIQPTEFYRISTSPGSAARGGFDRTFRFQCDGPDGLAGASCSYLPRFSVLASFVAISLFAAGPIISDDRETLHGMQPIGHLLFDDRYGEFAASKPMWCTALMLLWRSVTAIILQICWAVRSLLIPGLTLVGTVITLVDVDTVLDVILNSTAIGFV